VKAKLNLYTLLQLIFALFAGLPVLYTFASVFIDNPTLSADLNSLDTAVFLLLLRSMGLAALIAGASLIMGTILAFILYKTDIASRSVFRILMLIPLFVSPYILAVAWKDFFFFVFGSASTLNAYVGVFLVLLTVYTPLTILIVGSALANISAETEESALLFRGRAGVIRYIVLPLIKPALVSSFALVFIFSISNFAVPAFFGVKLFTTEIFTQFSAFYKHTLAILQSLFLIGMCVLLLLSEFRYIADAPFFSLGNRGARPLLYRNSKFKSSGIAFVWFWFSLSVLLPLAVLFAQAYSGGTDVFRQAFQLLRPAFAHSFLLALLSSLLMLLIGFSVAWYGQWMKRDSRFFNGLLLLVFTIPSVVLGISLIKFYNRPELAFIYSGYAILIIAFTAKFAFIPAKLLSNAVRQIPQSMRDAARIAGAGEWRIVRTILLPIIKPALFAAFIISFIFSLGELGTAIMVYPPGTEIMPIKVFTIMANAPQSLTASMNLIVFLISLLIIVGFSLLVQIFLRKRTDGHY
jgi:ABC-type Fe3+ transport system permease subunit